MYGAVDYVPLRLIRNVDFYDRLIMYHIADVGIVCNFKRWHRCHRFRICCSRRTDVILAFCCIASFWHAQHR